MPKRDIPELDLHNPCEQISKRGVFTHGRLEENIRHAPARRDLHRHQFHEISIFDTGHGEYLGDFKSHKIEAPVAVVTPAGTVHQWLCADHLEGDIMAFDLKFLEVTGRNQGAASILRPPLPVIIPLTDEQLALFHVYLDRIRDEWKSGSAYRGYLLSALLSIILIDLRQIHDELIGGPGPKTTPGRIYAAFLDELEHSWRGGVSAKEIAAKLNISPSHLSATLRAVSGSTTSELITERILLAAKRLLAHSRLSVAETAFRIGFEDPSYYTRFFKKHTGMTPKQFRLSLDED